MSKKSIKPPFTTDNSFDPEIYKNGQEKIKLKEIRLKQGDISFIHGYVVNLYVV